MIVKSVIRNRSTLLLLLLLLVSTAAARFTMLSRSDHAPGLDGYYYSGQIAAYNKFGSFKIPDSSPVLVGMALFARLFPDPVVANKLAAALMSTLLVLAVFLLVLEASGSKQRAFIAAVLAALSTALAYLSVELLKNLGAMVFFLLFLRICLRMGKRGLTPGRLLGASVLGILSFFSHRLTAGLLILTLILWPLFRFRKKLRLKYVLAALGGVTLLMVAALCIRGGLHPADISRFQGMFALNRILPVFSETFQAKLPFPIIIELTLALPLAWLFLIRIRCWPSALMKSLVVVSTLCFLPFWNLSVLDMGFRLMLGGLPIVIVLGLSLPLEPKAHLSERLRRLLPVTVTVGALLTWLYTGTAYREKYDPPYAFYHTLIKQFSLPAESLLICHRGLNLFYTYSTGRDGLNYLPEYHVSARMLWRLSYGVPFHDFQRVITKDVEEGRAKRLRFPYHLVREDAWQRYLAGIPARLAQSYRNWYNPHDKRPAFLQVHQP